MPLTFKMLSKKRKKLPLGSFLRDKPIWGWVQMEKYRIPEISTWESRSSVDVLLVEIDPRFGEIPFIIFFVPHCHICEGHPLNEWIRLSFLVSNPQTSCSVTSTANKSTTKKLSSERLETSLSASSHLRHCQIKMDWLHYWNLFGVHVKKERLSYVFILWGRGSRGFLILKNITK